MLRILIVDDHPIVRMGLRKILEEYPSEISLEEADGGREALAQVKRTRYDMVLLDISMPNMDGLVALENLKKLAQSPPVLMLTVYPEEEYAVRALKLGASGYMTKKAAPKELITAVKKILAGGRYVGTSLANVLVTDLVSGTEKPAHQSLSNRELLVMKHIASGRSIKEIAAELSLSPKTVSTYRSRILAKIQAGSNAELTRYCMKHNLID